MKVSIMGLKLAYHEFVVAFRSVKYEKLLDSSPTNAHLIRNAGSLERVCGALMPHMQRIVDLTPPDSEKHLYAKKRLDAVNKAYATAVQYKKFGDVAERVLGRRT